MPRKMTPRYRTEIIASLRSQILSVRLGHMTDAEWLRRRAAADAQFIAAGLDAATDAEIRGPYAHSNG